MARPFALTALAAVLLLGAAVLARPAAAAGTQPASRADTRINSLHLRLQITAAQEPLWQTVAQVMRDNDLAIEALEKVRAEGKNTMTAVDDLRSYGQLIDAHADGVKKLEPPFEALYKTLSRTQKHNADLIFRNERHPVQKKG
ncbi:Spy/CpxP family protein refolding chaperone [Bordetella sp. FB-8]|uniref:Spy/CpxP family protein refolding chaperone n=1 Tax=Bordetella sp. FB-8 TaxID=1159870 RepID=UPI000525688D|nr:Spy/CpxP family protein refolding chaperone [Bordetella sp. FB-8]